MVGRPRTIDNTIILDATARVIGRLGPARLTLADVAAEVGLAPATLVQRFGSKRGLLLAFAQEGAAAVGPEFAAARSSATSPLGAILAALVGLTRHLGTAEELSNHLAFLQLDLSDPDFHRLAIDHTRALWFEIQRLLDEAVNTGELTPCDTARLTRAIQSTFNGALVTWVVYREGTVADWVGDHLEILLQPRRLPSTG